MQEYKHAGFVAVVGRPSSGKSTFLNTLCGFKVSIVSPVPQTTRNRIRAVYSREEMQIVFLDTPGMHFSERSYNKELVHVAKVSLDEAEAVIYFSDLVRPFGDEEKRILALLANYEDKTVVALNKLDSERALDPKIRQREIEEYISPHDFCSISALAEQDCRELAERVGKILPSGTGYYPEEYYTDQSQEFRISELIREQIFLQTRQEVPHSTYIGIDNIEYREESDSIRIDAVIFCESDSQKGMLIGTKGKRIKQIGARARYQLESVFGKKTDLFLKVKVHRNWRKDQAFVAKKLGEM